LNDGVVPPQLRPVISSNAVYPLVSGSPCAFSVIPPVEEKRPDDIRAELDFLWYLRANNYPAAETLLSKNGRELETVNTLWGTSSAVVFEAVPGMLLAQTPLFLRYANLYAYTRILRSVSEKLDAEPDWMTELRAHLNNLMNEKRQLFVSRQDEPS